jgi:uncharacterized protein
MRIVAAPTGDGTFVAELDLRRRRPGRGSWLHPSPDCLDLALRRRAFVRALRIAGPLDTTALRAALTPYAAADQHDQNDQHDHTPGRSPTLRRRSEPEAGYSADEHPMSTQQ